MKQLAPLKDATDMGDCADAFVMLAKNGELATYQQVLTMVGSCTGATLTIDAGLSLMSRPRQCAEPTMDIQSKQGVCSLNGIYPLFMLIPTSVDDRNFIRSCSFPLTTGADLGLGDWTR